MGLKSEHFIVFNKRSNSIREAIKLAAEYLGTTFQVVKRVFNKDKIIFSIKLI
jgi:mannitol/fructose-specific phosphotransferase system IIA component (Ntr-type)